MGVRWFTDFFMHSLTVNNVRLTKGLVRTDYSVHRRWKRHLSWFTIMTLYLTYSPRNIIQFVHYAFITVILIYNTSPKRPTVERQQSVITYRWQSSVPHLIKFGYRGWSIDIRYRVQVSTNIIPRSPVVRVYFVVSTSLYTYYYYFR
jgi:hypothetical protein